MNQTHNYVPATVVERFSPARMARYLHTANGDDAHALELYGHQARVAATLWQTMGHVEIVIRNAMHETLSKRAVDWYDELAIVFDDETKDDIAKARRRVNKRGLPETPDLIVSELNFGFWRFLLSRKYDRFLWNPYLNRAFPLHGGARNDLYIQMSSLNDDRNAIAHHQRISNPKSVRTKCIDLVALVSQDAKAWIEQECRVMEAIADAPSSPPAP